MYTDEFGVQYTDDKKKLISAPSKLEGEYVVPAEVTDISYGAFRGCTRLQKITLPKELKIIWEYAFEDCEQLTEILIPEGVSRIGYGAFRNCKKIQKIILPQDLKSIEGGTFYGCESLTDIQLPEVISDLGAYAFWNCKNLQKIALPKGILLIRQYTFEGCEQLTDIQIPDGVTIIGNHAFLGCKKLQNLILPKELNAIYCSAFRYCESLTEITLPERVKSINEGAFADCVNLQEVVLPQRIYFESCAFAHCDALTGSKFHKDVIARGLDWDQITSDKDFDEDEIMPSITDDEDNSRHVSYYQDNLLIKLEFSTGQIMCIYNYIPLDDGISKFRYEVFGVRKLMSPLGVDNEKDIIDALIDKCFISGEFDKNTLFQTLQDNNLSFSLHNDGIIRIIKDENGVPMETLFVNSLF